MATEIDEIGGRCRDVATEVEEIGGWRRCRDVATEVDEIGGDAMKWSLKMMELERMS